MKKKHNFVMINYKKPDEERFTERFTNIYVPKSLRRIDAKASEEPTAPEPNAISSSDGEEEVSKKVRTRKNRKEA